MKKISLLILTLFLFFACYIIHQVTDDNTYNYVLIGDELVNNPYIIKNERYKNDFVSNDYRIIDLLRIIKYNEEILIHGKMVSIHQQLQEADILLLSIGIDEIVDNLNENTKDKYTYINKFIHNLRELFKKINQYDYKQIYFIGYNIKEKNSEELINYLNSNVKKLVREYGICFIDMKKIIREQVFFDKKTGLFNLNDISYRKIYDFIVENLEKC